MSKCLQLLKILLYIAEQYHLTILYMGPLVVCKAQPPRASLRTFPSSPISPILNHLKMFPMEIKIQVVLQRLNMPILDFKIWWEADSTPSNLNLSLVLLMLEVIYLMSVLWISINSTLTLRAAQPNMSQKKMKVLLIIAISNLLRD